MSRPAKLLFSHRRWESESPEVADVVLTCEDGIPAGWIMVFGGRNFWKPDEQVEQRGSASERNRYETPLDVGEARIGQAMENLRAIPHMWVWYATLEILQRRVRSRGKEGFLRVDANWAFREDGVRDRCHQLVSLAENSINMMSMGRFEHVGAMLAPLDEFCPFVPHCTSDDAKRFAKSRAFPELKDARRAAALMIGVPEDDRDRFFGNVDEAYAAEFSKLASLPPYPQAAPAKHGTAKSTGVLARIKGIFGK